MRFRYRNDEEMKDSGVEWLGPIPVGWRKATLRWYLNCKSGDFISSTIDEDGNKDIPIIGGNGVMGYCNKYNINETVLAVGRVGALCGNVHLINYPCWITDNSLIIHSIRKEISIDYLYMILLKLNLNSFSTSTAQPLITSETIKKREICLPRLTEQQKISKFLNEKTTQFDTIISKKEDLIKRLEEAKKSLISEVVTGKVKVVKPEDGYELVERKKEEMKDSGVEWLGDIPRSWNTTVLKNICKNITDGAHISPETEKGVYPFISVKDLKNDELDFYNCLLTSNESYEYLKRNACNPRIGDVLISKDGTIGKTTTITYEKSFVIASSLVILTPLKIYDSKYIEYTLNSNYVQKQIRKYVKGSALPRISITHLKGMVLPYTIDYEEQQLIVKCLNNKIDSIINSINNIKYQIAKLKEAKQSLISEAVTGKIEILE